MDINQLKERLKHLDGTRCIKTIKKDNKRYNYLTSYYYAMLRSGNYINSLYEAYENPSHSKRVIYSICRDIASVLGAKNYMIFSYNCMFFSFAFDIDDFIILITKSYIYIIAK